MKKIISYLVVLVLPSFIFIHSANSARKSFIEKGKTDTATFAAGCFWCVQAQFSQLKGVKQVVSGFSGGFVKNPSYKEVCTGRTGHAEACNIIYDPALISYDELLEAFFTAHDPTQLNRQGNDVGTQYRSAIFYHNEDQKRKAGYYIKKLNEAHAYKNKIVTQIAPYTVFYKVLQICNTR